MSRVVVVGAGVGGLATALRLRALGHDVTVLEAAEAVGGKAGVLERGGFRFDTGPSLVTLPHLWRELLDDTGGWPDDLVLRPLEPLARYRFADGTVLDASSDPGVMAERLDAALGPGAGAQWARVLERGRRVWEASREPFLEAPLRGLRTLGPLAVRRPHELPLVAPWRTLRDVGTRELRDPRLRQLLDRYATYSGSDPRRAPAALVSVPWAEAAYGGWWVEGGLRRLVDALARRAAELGVDVRTGAHVDRVVVEGGRATGVVVAGGRVPADVVVSDVDARDLYGRLVDAPRAARRLARTTPSLSGFVLLLGVRGTTPGLAHHNVLLPADYDAEFDAVFGDPARPVDDPAVYVSAPRDPAVAPPGHEAWFVLVNAPRHGSGPGAVDWRAPGVADAYAERVLDVLGERGLPVRDRLVLREAITPADLEQRTGAVGGAIYGTSSNGARAAFLRPANRSPVPGLLLVGGSAHPGGGLPLVLLSARIAAGLVGPA